MNSLTWGPDGWLYGNQGVFNASRVGRPGAPDGERVLLNAGIWRYVVAEIDYGRSQPVKDQRRVETSMTPAFFEELEAGGVPVVRVQDSDGDGFVDDEDDE